MSGQLFLYSMFMLAGTFISSVAQVLLKVEAAREHDSVLKEYLNPRVIIAYVIFFASTFLSIYAYRIVPLSMGPILESTGYIYVTIFGIAIFKEEAKGLKFFALLLIILGIIVYSTLG